MYQKGDIVRFVKHGAISGDPVKFGAVGQLAKVDRPKNGGNTYIRLLSIRKGQEDTVELFEVKNECIEKF